MGHIQPCPHIFVNLLKIVVFLSGIWTTSILFNPDLVEELGWWAEGIIIIYVTIGSMICFIVHKKNITN